MPLNDPPDGLGSQPSIADLLIDAIKGVDDKVTTLILSDGAQTQSLLDMNKRLSTAETTLAQHEALKNKGAGIFVVGSMVLAFFGVVFWKAVDFFISTKTGV